MAPSESKPFDSQDFKSWVVAIGKLGGKVSRAVTFLSGKFTCGDPELGLEA